MVVVATKLVSRSALWGGILFAFGVVQFVVAMAVVQTQYAGYSLLTNYISDLGNTATSPWHVVFNLSLITLGVTAFLGILLGWSGFPRGGPRVVGLVLLLFASVSAVVVGSFPENVNPAIHDTFSLLIFLPGGLGLAVVSFGMKQGTHWFGYRAFSLLLGLVTLASLAYYAPTQVTNTTFDPGLFERLIVAPFLIWGFVAGIHLTRLPRFSPTTRPTAV